jgi:uncharacterized membrane protein YhaH (DUF805 family)
MTFTKSVETCFSKYGKFEGRASRSEYWWFTLFIMSVQLVADIPMRVFENQPDAEGPFLLFSLLSLGVTLALFIPSLSVTARRLHDTGKSGWWMFFPLTIIGLIPFWIWTVSKGNEEANEYGPALVLE